MSETLEIFAGMREHKKRLREKYGAPGDDAGMGRLPGRAGGRRRGYPFSPVILII